MKYIAREKPAYSFKEAFNIEGLGKKVIDQFFDLNFITEPADIFTLDYSKIRKLEGWGDLSIDNLKMQFLNQKISLEKFIFSIGIRHRSRKCKILQLFFISQKTFPKYLTEKVESKS